MKTNSYSSVFFVLGISFVAILMISNTVAVKLVQIGPFVFTGAILIFPISYIFGDILTEVYGYRATRIVIWSGFAALAAMSMAYAMVSRIPAASFWSGQSAYESILGVVPRVVIASITAYFVGEFANSYVLSRMKVAMNGRHLWMRTIGSTIVGEGVDTVVFITIVFYGTITGGQMMALMASGYIFKVLYEVIATPLTYYVVRKLKEYEDVDAYDTGIRYNPFDVLGK